MTRGRQVDDGQPSVAQGQPVFAQDTRIVRSADLQPLECLIERFDRRRGPIQLPEAEYPAHCPIIPAACDGDVMAGRQADLPRPHRGASVMENPYSDDQIEGMSLLRQLSRCPTCPLP